MNKLSKQLKKLRLAAKLCSFFNIMSKVSSLSLAVMTVCSVLKTSLFIKNVLTDN